MASDGRRAPPAFQTYAASTLADRDFKLMCLAERGLAHTMDCEYWTNGALPSDPRALARMLGLEATEVEAHLTPRVLARYEQRGDLLVHPQLEAYRAHLDERHARMSQGGTQSAEAINRRRRMNRQADSHPDSEADSPLSTAQQSTAKSNPAVREAAIPEEHKEWLKDYDAAAFDVAGRVKNNSTPPQKTNSGSRSTDALSLDDRAARANVRREPGETDGLLAARIAIAEGKRTEAR